MVLSNHRYETVKQYAGSSGIRHRAARGSRERPSLAPFWRWRPSGAKCSGYSRAAMRASFGPADGPLSALLRHCTMGQFVCSEGGALGTSSRPARITHNERQRQNDREHIFCEKLLASANTSIFERPIDSESSYESHPPHCRPPVGPRSSPHVAL